MGVALIWDYKCPLILILCPRWKIHGCLMAVFNSGNKSGAHCVTQSTALLHVSNLVKDLELGLWTDEETRRPTSPSVSIKQQQLGLRLPTRHRAERQRKEAAVSAVLKESSRSSCTRKWTYQKIHGVGKDTLESRPSASNDLRWKKLLWKVNTHRKFHRSTWLGRQKRGSRWR